MPKLKYIQVICPHCGDGHKVRIERIDNQPFECLACGGSVDTRGYVSLVKLLHDYSEVILDLEQRGKVEGEVFVPMKDVEYGPSLW